MRRLAVVAIVLLSACTPAQIAAFRYVQDHRPTTCHAAVDMYWPASSRGWATTGSSSVSRGGNAGGQNRRSSAAGCFGIIRGTWNAQGTGIPWGQRYDAVSNVQVALVLYQRAGTRPWR